MPGRDAGDGGPGLHPLDSPGTVRGTAPGLGHELRALLTERNFLVCLLVTFIAMAVWVSTVPYDPMRDIADATTNVIWSEYYREGRFAVPFIEWVADGRPMTQSSVVMLNDEPYVVNEKGPVHALIAMVLGPATGTLLAAVAVASTYMLGRRLLGWQAGAVASVLVLTNLTVVAMWYRYWWVDASTMALLTLSMWLLVESVAGARAYLGSGARKDLLTMALVGALGGIAFGASVGTRYTVGAVLLAVPVYLLALSWRRFRDALRGRDLRALGRTVGRMSLAALPFVLGLLVVLLPLLSYNTTYFGGPFHSGYDATSLMDYERSHGTIDTRNQTEQLFLDPLGKVSNIVHNTIVLAPLILSRMLALLFVPYAVWRLRGSPALYLLLPWLLVIMLGFLSMSWIDRYTRAFDIPWEPRYFLPALPPAALLAGYSIHEVGRRLGGGGGPGGSQRRGDAAFALTVTVIIALSGILPAEANFADIRAGGAPTTQGGDGQNPPAATVVTVSRLYAEAAALDKKPIELRGGQVVSVQRAGGTGQVVAIQVRDPSTPLNLTVRFMDYPAGAVPDIRQGQTVSVFGIFVWQDQNRDGRADPGEPVVNIRYGNPDKVVIGG